MPSKVLFLAEGNAEKCLLRWFKVPDDQIWRVSGSSGIAAAMRKHEDQGGCVLVGLTDDDKTTPAYFDVDVFEEEARQHDLILKKHPRHQFHLIVVCPEFEQWLLSAAGQVHVDLAAHGLPAVAKKLHKITASEQLAANRNFKAFFGRIQAGNPPAFQTLAEWLMTFRKMGFHQTTSD